MIALALSRSSEQQKSRCNRDGTCEPVTFNKLAMTKEVQEGITKQPQPPSGSNPGRSKQSYPSYSLFHPLPQPLLSHLQQNSHLTKRLQSWKKTNGSGSKWSCLLLLRKRLKLEQVESMLLLVVAKLMLVWVSKLE